MSVLGTQFLHLDIIISQGQITEDSGLEQASVKVFHTYCHIPFNQAVPKYTPCVSTKSGYLHIFKIFTILSLEKCYLIITLIYIP